MKTKTTKKTTTAALPVSSLDVLAALLAGPEQDTTMQNLLPLAEAELRALVNAQFHLSEVSQAAHRMVDLAGGAAVLRDIERLKKRNPAFDDALCEVEWRNAEAGFALGVLVGQRIGGAR